MNTVQKPITSQPSPTELAQASMPSAEPANEVVVTQPLPVPELNDESPDVTDTEEEKKKKRRKQDCCFYIDPNDDPYDWLILCRCIFWICRSIGNCTERCCDCCAENIHECCNGDGGCCDTEGGCCGDDCCGDDCCGDGCCDGNGESGGDTGDCLCDCTCDD